MKLGFNMGVQKRSQTVLMELVIPMCNDCAGKERRITSVTLLPFFVGGLIIAVLAFIPTWLLTPQGTTTQTLSLPWVVGGCVGLFVGIIGGTVIEFISRLLFSVGFGPSLTKRPLTIFEFFNDSEHILGLSGKLSRDKKSLHLEFENDEIAREFTQLNPQEMK